MIIRRMTVEEIKVGEESVDIFMLNDSKVDEVSYLTKSRWNTAKNQET